MSYFKFCPNCASQNFVFENNRRFECCDCGMVFFQNVVAAVAVIMEKDNKILFTVRNREPRKNMLDLPGGFTDPDESVESTCARELKEELDLDMKPKAFKYLGSLPNTYLYKGIPYKTSDLIFTAELPETFKLKLEESEIKDVRWIEKSKIDLSEIAFDSLRKAVGEYIAGRKLS